MGIPNSKTSDMRTGQQGEGKKKDKKENRQHNDDVSKLHVLGERGFISCMAGPRGDVDDVL
jgi:hypothetical protein